MALRIRGRAGSTFLNGKLRQNVTGFNVLMILSKNLEFNKGGKKYMMNRTERLKVDFLNGLGEILISQELFTWIGAINRAPRD